MTTMTRTVFMAEARVNEWTARLPAERKKVSIIAIIFKAISS